MWIGYVAAFIAGATIAGMLSALMAVAGRDSQREQYEKHLRIKNDSIERLATRNVRLCHQLDEYRSRLDTIAENDEPEDEDE